MPRRPAPPAFARGGYAGTGLDDVAAEAGVTRVLLYRHFDSKADLYRAILLRAGEHLAAAVGGPDYTERIVDDLLTAAAADPAGFRLLLHHAAREPEFRAEVDRYRAEMVATADAQLAALIPDPGWLGWAAHLAPNATVAATTAWLDAGRPDPGHGGRAHPPGPHRDRRCGRRPVITKNLPVDVACRSLTPHPRCAVRDVDRAYEVGRTATGRAVDSGVVESGA